jgi:hypothetical protein
MKITAQTEVSPSNFMMPNENGQASMDFLFVLFLQLIQSALDILNPSEVANSDLGRNKFSRCKTKLSKKTIKKH